MLSYKEIKQLPKTTKHNWNKFENENYYGHEWAIDYINKFENIKEVYSNKYVYRTTRTICKLSSGFKNIISELTNNKKALKKHAKNITYAIGHTQQYTKANISTICKFYGISKDWYYRQKKSFVCNKTASKRCIKQHPNQLTIDEVDKIDKALSSPINKRKTKITIYYEALRLKLFTCSLSTFYKYSRELGYKRAKKKHPIIKKGYKAEKVFEALHVDVTFVRTVDDGVQKVAFVKDNKSLAILNYASTSNKADSLFIKKLLVDTFYKYKLLNHTNTINIISDGGSENKGHVTNWITSIKAPPAVIKITANTPNFPFSNSMSESTHSIYKSEFLGGMQTQNIKKHNNSLKQFVEYYNTIRFPASLLGLHPAEVLKGMTPDKHMFTEQITESSEKRKLVNRNYTCCFAFNFS